MSKALKSFYRIKNYQTIVDAEKDEVKTVGELLPSSCNEIEKALKALVLIKEKKVDCLVLVLSQSYIKYNNICETEKDKLTQAEYDLLKEILS